MITHYHAETKLIIMNAMMPSTLMQPCNNLVYESCWGRAARPNDQTAAACR